MIVALTASIVALTLGQGVTKNLGTLDKPVSWDTLEARYKCGPKESKPDCATRLRDALVKELAKPKLSLAMPSLHCSDTEKRQRCAVTLDGCMPLAGLIVNALAELGPAAAVALPEVKQAGERDVSMAQAALRTRIAAGDGGLFDTASKLLDDSETDCRWEGASMLGRLGSPEAVHRLVDYLHHGPWADRHRAAEALALSNPEAIAALTAVLDEKQQPSSVLFWSARSLRGLGHLAVPAAVPALQRLATQHFSYDVRESAAKALLVMGQTAPKTEVRKCSRPDAGLSLGAGTDDLSKPQVSPGCPPGGEYNPLSVKVDGICVTGVGLGEFGGKLMVDKKPVFEEWHSNPGRLLELKGHHYLVQGLRHMSTAGEIDELLHDASGWRVEFVTDLPGAVRALKVNADESLELLTDDASTGSNCEDGLRVHFEPGATEFSFVR